MAGKGERHGAELKIRPGMIAAYSWGQEDFEAEDKDGESSAQGLADDVL